MADIKKSVNLLPEYLRSDKNSKFLSATIDPLIQSPQLERIDGFVGSKLTRNYNTATDFYIQEDSSLRTQYSLTPSLVFKDASSKITDVVSFDDIINEIGIQGGKVDNLDRIFRSKFYSYDPYIDWDKLINYSHYYWLYNGPDSILIDYYVANIDTDIVGQTTYDLPYINKDTGKPYSLSNGMKLKFSNLVQPSAYHNKEYYVEGVGNRIKLIDVDLLDVNELVDVVYNETFDGDSFDDYPFDGDKKLPIIPEYVTINKASDDLNPWSRYNRWFHEDVIKITAKINGQSEAFSIKNRAKRPIIEFKPNIQLYNFGRNGIGKVDFIDTITTDILAIQGQPGYYVDGVLLEHGQTVIFNADVSVTVNGEYLHRGKIYTVQYGLINNELNLSFVNPVDPSLLDSIVINYGNVNAGSCWYYHTAKWVQSQQHTKLNQAPLFDLFDNNHISYVSDPVHYDTSFAGSKIFGYEIGTGSNDTVLGFPLKYKNSVVVGSYLFKNYFTTDTFNMIVNGVTTVKSTGLTYFRVNNNLPNQTDSFLNVWRVTPEYQIPVTDGYYDTPVGLTNNPLNGTISELTLSELSDHLLSMTSRIPNFKETSSGTTNLRDINNYSQYGKQLIINSNPMAFAQLFFGKKEHNIVDAIQNAEDQYNQFKLNLLRIIATLDSQLSPADALDIALLEINNNKTAHTPYYRSDMLGYGSNKTVKTYTVSNIDTVIYPIGVTFNIAALSFESLLVYKNGHQLNIGSGYDFTITNDEIEIYEPLTVGDTITITYYLNTLGSFIPATPSKLGLYPAYEPIIFSDYSYNSPDVILIQGHDGSHIKAYGDYRDDIILEYEKRVYNNIKVKYNPAIFDITSAIPGAFRNDTYTSSDANDLLVRSFIKWTGRYNIDASTNNIYDEGNPFTWNYNNSINTVTNISLSGHWRSIYNYFYDTDRPDTHPWEMLGHSSKPSWWDNYYSWTDTDKRAALIDAIQLGKVTPSSINNSYARPNFNRIVPVDEMGVLLSPAAFLASENDYYDKTSNWMFGNQGPAETAWRKSSHWPFALNVAAALLYPSMYSAYLYDVSRISINPNTNQLNYINTDLYLNPNKLIINGYNNEQTAGFSVYIIENGLQKDLNYLSSLKQDLEYINVNLFHKVGGFVTKDKLQVVIDSVDPTSQSYGAILPPENYQLILNVSNPIKSSRISGVVVQKSNGKFIVKGYDNLNPYFEILNPIKSSASGAITVGGKEEAFTEWTGETNAGGAIDMTTSQSITTKYYKQGQLVRYNNRYYRVKVGHTTQSTFDFDLFYSLPSLPMVGGSTAQLVSTFENTPTRVAYGTTYSTIQEVYDLLVGYGAYLESQGFIFDEYNSELGEVVDWKFTGKEFLYWTTQNWADGNLITLSPFADYLKYSFKDSIVDNISTGEYEYSLLKADGKSFPVDKFRLSREDGICVINTIDTLEGIFFAKLNSVQKEHGMVLDNTTIFNDTIYDIETGYQQRRIKLSGFRTSNWNGDLSSPGFVYDSVDITDWAPYKIYLPGKVVRYNGSYYESNTKVVNEAKFDFNKWDKLNSKPESNLLPNFDYKIKQFEDFYSLDIDNFDTAQQQLAQHLIGYTPRVYLNNIFSNPIAQYKFYQGFIKEKGTKNAIDKLSKAGRFTRTGDVSFTEDWAFRVGQYGSFETYNEIEFPLVEGLSLENPHVVKFVKNIPTDTNSLINYQTPTDLLIVPKEYVSSSTFNSYAGTFADNNLKLVTAGYVRVDDVTATAYNKYSLLDIANNSLIKEGDTIWLGFLENGGWGVYRYTKEHAKVAGVFVDSPGASITFTTDVDHNLSVGDTISIVKFNEQVNGIHIITDIPQLNQITVSSELTTIANAELLSYGLLFKFKSARFNNFSELINTDILSTLNVGDKIWIDNGVNGKWQVYEKVNNYGIPSYNSSADSVSGQNLGESLFTVESNIILMGAAPGKHNNDPKYGNVGIYYKTDSALVKQFEYTLNTNSIVYCQENIVNEFGYSLSYDIGKELFFAGAPAASNIVVSTDDALKDGIVIKSIGSGTPKSFAYEGLVKISRANSTFSSENTEIVLVNPYSTTTNTASHARFGHSIYSNQVLYNTSTTLLVGAPGDSINTYTGKVYAYSVNSINNTKATTSSVIYAFAITDIAPVYYGDATIQNWRHYGLDEFVSFYTKYRLDNPDAAKTYDKQRADDAIGTINTRAEVIAAYQNNINAQLYPDEASIRYWMLNGLGVNNAIFNESVRQTNLKYPNLQQVWDKQREDERISINNRSDIAVHPSGINLQSDVNLNFGSQFGHKIAGNSTGTIIAVSAPYYTTITNRVSLTGVVQLYNKNLQWFQSITSPFNTSDSFGDDVVISPSGSYMAISSKNAKTSTNAFGKVAIYKLSGDGNFITTTRAEVILAMAANLLAPVYYGEVTILNWMNVGLSGFDQFWISFRSAYPADAVSIDAERAADAIGLTGRPIVNTRAEVIAAYQTNPDAQLYPDEAGIRYWMTYGLGVNNSIFNASVDAVNLANPLQQQKNIEERANASVVHTNYSYTLFQIINNPISNSNLKFGSAMSISDDNNTLVISALGKKGNTSLKFDETSKNGETTFDGAATTFGYTVEDSGAVYVYNNVSSQFIYSEEIRDWYPAAGDKFGYAVAATNNKIYVGAPSSVTSYIYQFNKSNTDTNGIKLLREQPELVDLSTIDRVALIDSSKDELVEYLDVIDPVKGKIAGIAEQELTYKSAYDPATYSVGIAASIVDNNTSWIDDHIGELWWDLSTVKYQWYEQGDEIFRKNNWGKLFPGSSIDVYEWVRTPLLPSEWAAQADTTAGLTNGISGQPKYPDNSVVSVKQVFNNVTGSFESIYFFWVKNKVTVPDVKSRRISGYQVAQIIVDPVSNGLKFIEILSADAVAFANVQSMLVGDKINANIAINSNRSEIPRHTEWALIAEGTKTEVPPLLEKKLIDSLLGRDSLSNPVPDPSLSYRNRYGIGIRPQQTLFKDRISALRNQIKFANSILINEKITGNYDFNNNLNTYDLIPDETQREYDLIVSSVEELANITYSNTVNFKQAKLVCSVHNGKISSVEILDGGYNYTLPPAVTIVSSSGRDAVILTEIDINGEVVNASISNPGNEYVTAPQLTVRPHTVIVSNNLNYHGRWTKHEYDYSASSNILQPVWYIIKNQTFDTTLYWTYVDWVSDSYSQYKNYRYFISGAYDLQSLTDIKAGDYVKIKNIGDSRYVILEKLAQGETGDYSHDPAYKFVYIEKGTIQISDDLWNYANINVSYDNATIEETTYDQVPNIELSRILSALKDDIFINDLKIYWNKFFFAAVKYALTEQKLLDWAFKTSFINVVNNIGLLDQRPVYKLDNEQYFESYINEVKPYHTNVRTYISKYSYLENQLNEGVPLSFTDFDLPSYYNTITNMYDVINIESLTPKSVFNLTNTITTSYPWKSWADNYTYSVGSIIVGEHGTLYTQVPTVTITGGGPSVTVNATADAYIRNGGVYQILVTNPGAGYTENPTVVITGGGPYVTVNAIAAPSLLNLTTRKNIIGMKFDRVSAQSEIGEVDVNDTFICSGKDDKFILSLLALQDKHDIVPVLDSKLILSTDYTIEYYDEEYNGYTKKYSKFVFLNYIPAQGSIFKISYKKNINLYTAVDRITHFDTSTNTLSSLMTGVTYPNNIIQGLPFEYSGAWDNNGSVQYDLNAWSENINYYASAKLVMTANAGTSTLYLNTTTDIIPGQVISISNTSTILIRKDTVVVSVDALTNSITISQPYYIVQTIRGTGLDIGSDIIVNTSLPFNGNIVVGDTATINGVLNSEFNGQFVVSSIVDNNTFIVKANSLLTTTSTIITYGDANVTVSTLPTTVESGSVLLSYSRDSYDTVSNGIVAELNVSYNKISKIKIFLDGLTLPMNDYPTGAEYYIATRDSVTGNTIITFYQMYNSSYDIEFYMYEDPMVEFWKNDITSVGVESNITGGAWAWGNFVGGAGVTFTSTSVLSGDDGKSIIIDGDSFLNVRDGYAPEECVSGHVLDSLGINVYTRDDNSSYPTVITGTFPINSGTNFPSATLSVPMTNVVGMMVHYNGKIFDRVGNQNECSTPDKYFMFGNKIYLSPQTVSGWGGYTMITAGGNSLIDSNMITVPPDTSVSYVVTVESLASVHDVKSTYVQVDGLQLDEITEEESSLGYYGYILGSVSDTNNRASAKIYNLTPGSHNVEAWFFRNRYNKFNRVTEEVIETGDGPNVSKMFTLSLPPGRIEPVSEQTIVEVTNNSIVDTIYDIPYGTNFLQKVDLLVPQGFKRGVIIHIHGGSWGYGSKSASGFTPADAAYSTNDEAEVQLVAKAGYIVINCNYRLTSLAAAGFGGDGTGGYPNAIEDIKTILNYCFVRGAGSSQSEYWNEIAEYVSTYGLLVTGISAGAHLAVMGVGEYGVQSGHWPKAVGSAAGPMDLVYSPNGKNDNPVDAPVQTIFNRFSNPDGNGSTTGYNDTKAKASSPRYRYGTSSSPGVWYTSLNASPTKFFFIQNTNDTLVLDTMVTPFINSLPSSKYILETVTEGTITPGVYDHNFDTGLHTHILDFATNAFNTAPIRRRLSPPWASYYTIKNNQLTFNIDNKNTRPSYTYDAESVFVYANGVELRRGFDYSINEAACTITIVNGLLKNNDAVAVVGLVDYDYVIKDNVLTLTDFIVNSNIKVTSFTDHDNMLIRTERFNATTATSRHYQLSYPVLSDDYVWVYLDGIPLTSRYDFELSDDLRSIYLNNQISFQTTSTLLVTSINPPTFGNQIVGYRMFTDMFDKRHFKRIAESYSTTLLQPLRHNDDSIYLTDGNSIVPPNPAINKPGVVIIDGERIEFAEKDGNILKRLRRSTLGTGPANFSAIGTQVIDQSLQQTIPYVEKTLVQTTSTTATTYVISTLTTTATGAGIVLDPGIDAANQVTVYYGGRQLRKSPLIVHDKFYDLPVYNAEPRTAYILMIGQSNIANYGIHTDSYTPRGNVQRLDINGNWEAAVSPAGPNRLATGYNWSTGSAVDTPGGISGGNMDGRIGDALIDSGLYDKVYIVNIAVGGVPLKWWLSTALTTDYNKLVPRGEDSFTYKNNRLYERIQFAVDHSKKYKFNFTHVFMDEGETDSLLSTLPSDYKNQFAQFKNEIKNLGIHAPVYLSKTSYTPSVLTNSTIVNTQQDIINTYVDVYNGPNTDNYITDYRWDTLHFNVAGLDAVGKDWGNSVVLQEKLSEPIAPEFSINTSTYELSLNILDYNGIATDITIVQKKGQIWTGTESLLTSNVVQAEFLRKKKSILPDIYYYGGDAAIKDQYDVTLTDENDQPLEGY